MEREKAEARIRMAMNRKVRILMKRGYELSKMT